MLQAYLDAVHVARLSHERIAEAFIDKNAFDEEEFMARVTKILSPGPSAKEKGHELLQKTLRDGKLNRHPTEKQFQVALSFPGEKRDFVEKVAATLSKEFGKKRVFYDEYFKEELARPNLDTYLEEIYRKDSELIVVFISAEFATKEWCGLEMRAIRDLIKTSKSSNIMLVKFDDADTPGLFSIDGYLDASELLPRNVASLIIRRYKSNTLRNP